ncbi:MAG: UDP-N-acetylmuramate dehydrogenase, partial [Sphingomonadales bacterium]
LGKPFGNITIDCDLVTAGAGATDVAVAHNALGASLSGLEFLRGVPGTIGGALRMNAGAYGAEVANVFVAATAIDRTGALHTLGPDEMGFSYRQTQVPPDWIFLSGTFRTTPGDKKTIREKMDEIQAAREATQPMRVKTGGSTFKNPAGDKAWKLIEDAGCRGLKVGAAKVSEKHCNFLINTGDASAKNLEDLGEAVRRTVLKNSGVSLKWEIERIGEA